MSETTRVPTIIVSTLLGALLAVNAWIMTSIIELKVKVATIEAKQIK